MSDRETPTLAAKIDALNIVVKALARSQAKRSPAAIHDMLDYIAVEADRLTAASHFVDSNLKETVVALDTWIDDLKREAALGDFETANAGGRRIHFVD
jgi:hypothetical protein